MNSCVSDSDVNRLFWSRIDYRFFQAPIKRGHDFLLLFYVDFVSLFTIKESIFAEASTFSLLDIPMNN